MTKIPLTMALALTLAAALGLSAIAAVGYGAASIPFAKGWAVIVHELWPTLGPAAEASRAERNIVWELRLPRILLSALAGAGLAAVGAVMQIVTRNPLADPYLFGISAGASLGAVLVLLRIGPAAGTLGLPAAAFLGAVAAMAVVFAAARGRDGVPTAERLVLTGVAVAFILHAVTNALVVSAMDRGAEAAMFWMMGGFATARWSLLPVPAAVSLAGLVWLYLRADNVDVLALGDDAARSIGIDPQRLRLELVLVTSLMTGALVSVCGGIGFVGLVMPHLARMAVGGRLRLLLPVAALGGALLMLWADAAARTLFAPKEIPVGVVTALLGGVFFLWLMRRRSATR